MLKHYEHNKIIVILIIKRTLPEQLSLPKKMKINRLLLQKTACLLSALIFTSSLYSQIIYTDITDATPNATYALDLNNDLIVDFSIQFAMANKVMCVPQNNNAYAGNMAGSLHLPWALPASAAICNTLATWYDATHPGTMAFGTSTGHWVGETDKYLALKLIVGANTYYGWARLDVMNNSGSFTLKDYAYQSTPNTCIQAGQIALGVAEHTNKTTFSIYPNPLTSSTTLQTTGDLKNTSLTIFNSCGQTIKQINNLSGHTLTISRNDLPAGLYFMQLTKEQNIIVVEKLIITD